MFIIVEGSRSCSIVPYAQILRMTMKKRQLRQRIRRISRVERSLSPLSNTESLKGSTSSLLGKMYPEEVCSISYRRVKSEVRYNENGDEVVVVHVVKRCLYYQTSS